MFKPSIVDKLDEDLADVLAKAAIFEGAANTGAINQYNAANQFAPPIIRAPSASAESVRAAYEAAAVRAEQVAEELANLLTVERDSAIKLAAELRKVGDREAEAISKVCDRAAEAHKLLETLRKGLTEGEADSK